MSDALNSRERFLSALRGQALERPPVWLMRQAGRYLPEYRALKERYDFVTMVRTPEIAVEVTLQPLKRYPLDAAILFSDILVVPEAMGQPYHFRDGGGIGMDYRLDSADAIHSLNEEGAADRLQYVADAMRATRGELQNRTALLGFCGSPWTLACYMVEGGSSKDFSRIKSLAFGQPKLFESLMQRLANVCADYLNAQLEAGADAVQIFDSWAAICPVHNYESWSLRWIRAIIERLPKNAPVIVFAKGMCHQTELLLSTGARVLGMDWTVNLAEVAAGLPPHVGVQGNLDPVILTTSPEITRTNTRQLLDSMSNRPGFIFNLGHGMLPSAQPDNVAALVETVVEFTPTEHG
jgi:uroporphyrinogen decarboxylase